MIGTTLDGNYRIELLVVHDDSHVVWRQEVLAFEVHDDASVRSGWFGRWHGAVRPILPWTTELLVPGTPDEPAR